MAKFNRARVKPPHGRSPVVVYDEPHGLTYEGAPGYARDPRSELFLLAVTNMVGEDTFYEGAGDRDLRFRNLVRRCAVEYPDWTAHLIAWLRRGTHLRSAAGVAAAEFTWAHRQENRIGRALAPRSITTRAVVRSALLRLDDALELLAYWITNYGRALPKPVKRGVGDALIALTNEYTYLKYGSPTGGGLTLADALSLTHLGDVRGACQRRRDSRQYDLFAYAAELPHNPDAVPRESLRTVRARRDLFRLPVADRRAALDDYGVVKRAGLTWEAVAGWLQGPLDARVWEALIPGMGYLALLRNLRNFDETGVSNAAAERVCAVLADPVNVAKSRVLPLRFATAFREVSSTRWSWALERALDAALMNVPRLRGRTLVLVDTSGSMSHALSARSTVPRWDAAALFGLALALRADAADVYSYSTNSREFSPKPGTSLLAATRLWRDGGFNIGAGTNTLQTVKERLRPGHDRVVILTDEQTTSIGHRVGGPGSIDAVVGRRPIYTWNLAGYRVGHLPSTDGAAGPRHTFGGLTDRGFELITLLESGADGSWPWESND